MIDEIVAHNNIEQPLVMVKPRNGFVEKTSENEKVNLT